MPQECDNPKLNYPHVARGSRGRGLAFGGRLPATTKADDDASPSRLVASAELVKPSFECDRPECFFLRLLLGESESDDKLRGDGGVNKSNKNLEVRRGQHSTQTGKGCAWQPGNSGKCCPRHSAEGRKGGTGKVV